MEWNPAALKSKRLFEAADALLRAMEGQDGASAGVSMWVDDPRHKSAPPTGAFSQSELVEAMCMLVRLGYAKTAEQQVQRKSPHGRVP